MNFYALTGPNIYWLPIHRLRAPQLPTICIAHHHIQGNLRAQILRQNRAYMCYVPWHIQLNSPGVGLYPERAIFLKER